MPGNYITQRKPAQRLVRNKYWLVLLTSKEIQSHYRTDSVRIKLVNFNNYIMKGRITLQILDIVQDFQLHFLDKR